MPDPLPGAEDASSFVLDQLTPEDRARFEAELARSPELQADVGDLHLVTEALALAAPPCPPPARAWDRIAARTQTAPTAVPGETTRPTPWRLLLGWFANGWAVAALLAAAFVAHVLFERLDPTRSRHSSPRSGAGDGLLVDHSTSRPGSGPGNRAANPMTVASAGHETGPSGHSATNDPQTTSQLRDRVRLLSEQVALLSRILTQRAVVPAGASRLQVFRLVATNATLPSLESTPEPRLSPTPMVQSENGPALATHDDSSTGGSPPADPDVSLALAMAAARQLAAYTPPTSTPSRAVTAVVDHDNGGLSVDTTFPGAALPTENQSPSSETTGAPTLAREPILFVDLAAPVASLTPSPIPSSALSGDPGVVSADQDSAFGAFSPDSGTGAVAFRLPTESPDQGVYQLWITDAQTGAVQSLGFASANANAAAQVLVMKFSADATSFSTPTFLITREPTGGSLVPTGPVIAVPPTTSPSP